MDKKTALEKIADQIASCDICKKGKHGEPVPGEGNPSASVVFIGEAPGREEAATGRPFVGRSGQLLRSMIRSIGLKEEDVYITSPVKYLPDYGTPKPSDIQHGKIHLDKQLDVIQPKIIVLLGNTAIKALLKDHVPILSHHGELVMENGRKFFLMLHPAAVIRFSKYKNIFLGDFGKLKSLI